MTRRGGADGVRLADVNGDAPTDPWPGQIIKVTLPEGMGMAKGVRTGDINGDGDLDVLTCEERYNRVGLGVFWHENPFGGGKNADQEEAVKAIR